ncbi:hypothetical protein [Aeropyrum camini]|uniref:Uncharacterized protein n=1 Tax=Aeropyrum camini SY1 = JCM 12091 TaxID=1198449 RepID=U3TE28_9CREN|nr:hypothetical protein [Aeropyrum camini]BAN90290.1 hypothetical protein ACAM_0821 [Aeropyrum camini SY1 = JCM 12091]
MESLVGSSRWLDALRVLSLEWLRIAVPVLLGVYLAELIFNRVLFRVIIFIPYGEAQDVVGSLITASGVTAVNLSVLASLATLLSLPLYMDRFRYVPLVIAAFYFFDYLGIARLYWTLPLLSAYILAVDPRRVAEALFLGGLALNSMIVSPELDTALNIAWLVLPLTYLAAVRRLHTPKGKTLILVSAATLLSLLLAAGNTYITGQILVFAMKLLSPWLLPPAIILYSLTGSPGLLGVLMTGPGVQISSQVLVVSSLYLLELNKRRWEAV